MILKDEAHHIYNFEKAWEKRLLELNKNLEFQYGKGINMELDFTATPKTETGALFPWIIVDFSLKEAIEMNIEIDKLPSLAIPLENNILEMEYVAVDMIEGMEVIKRKWDLPVPQDSKSVIAYYTDQILKQLKIGGTFATFYPLMKNTVVEKLFSEKVDLDDLRVLYKLISPEVQEQLIRLFVESFKDKAFVEREPEKRIILSNSRAHDLLFGQN